MLRKFNIILLCILLLVIGYAYADPATQTDLGPPSVTITIWFETNPPLHIGDTIRICSEVIGDEGQMLEYQWQYSIDGEKDWIDIEGANEPIYEFILTEENAFYYYRLTIYHYWPIEEGEDLV